jgi:hypothetical protein
VSMSILNGSYNGVTWGPAGTYRCDGMSGFDDLPVIVSTDQPKSLGDGLFVGEDRLGEHSVVVRLAAIADSDAALRTAMDAINAAFSRQLVPKALRWWDLTRYVWARPRQRIWTDMGKVMADGVAKCEVRLVLADPNAYIGVPP